MEHSHYKKIYESLKNGLKASIKVKIGNSSILPMERKQSLYINNPAEKRIKNLIEVRELTQNTVIFKDDSTVNLTDLENFEDLLDVLKYVELWLNEKKTETIQISWSIQDLEIRASELENAKNCGCNLYDRKKFPIALNKLEKNHDCNQGITWEHIDYYLYEYCSMNSENS